MSERNTYWLVGDAPPTPVSPSSPISTPDSSQSNNQRSPGRGYRTRHVTTAQTERRPPTLVAIHPDCSISWVTSQNSSANPVAVSRVEDTPSFSPILVGDTSDVQHVPPTHQRHDSGLPVNVNESIVQDIASSSNVVTSSTSNNNSDLGDIPSVNYRDDIKLDDNALVTISTKDLNRRLTKAGISKTRRKQIKSERRTLKNRGYASSCRVSREDEEQQLERDILELQREIDKYPPVEQLEQRYTQLRKDVKDLKTVMNITDSDDSLSDPGTTQEEKIKTEQLSSTDQENEKEESRDKENEEIVHPSRY